MACSSKGIFTHSVPVPRIYKVAAKVAKNVKEGKDSLKNLVYNEKHVNIKTLYALIVETFKRDQIITELIDKSQLLVNEPRFDLWLAKILICEMLWGKNKMKGDSKPVQTILGYEEQLRKLIKDCNDIPKNVLMHQVSKPRYARVNTLKITMEEAVNNFRDEGWTLIPFLNKLDYEGFLERLNNLKPQEFMLDLHIPDLLIFPPKTEFYRHDAYKSRSIILQDKASCLPVHLLNPSPGSIVMDMCAAPGMKTTQLAAMLKDSGVVHAVEIDKNRSKVLREFVESTGATCVKTILKDVMQVKDADCPGVEYILVDPSCSGSGITDRIEVEDLDLSNKVQRLRKLCAFQAKLLRHALSSFPNAKRVVYSTCSINSEENEDVVRQVLETCKTFKLVNAKTSLKSWNESGSEVFPELGKMCIYASPEKDKTNGFFIAVLERLKDGERNPYLNVQLCKMFDREFKAHRRLEENQEKKEDEPRNIFTKEIKYENQFEFEDNSNIDLGAEYEYTGYKKRPKSEHKMGVETNNGSTIIEEVPIKIENSSMQKRIKNEYDHYEDKETNPNTEEIFNDKKRRRRRDTFAENQTENVIENSDLDTKKKIKIKIEENEFENQKQSVTEEISKLDPNDKSKKKNKIKIEENETENIVEDCNKLEMQEVPNKKSKKKHKIKEEASEVENQIEHTNKENSMQTNELSHKKSKRENKLKEEGGKLENITEENSMETKETSNKKSKKKNKIKEEGNELENQIESIADESSMQTNEISHKKSKKKNKTKEEGDELQNHIEIIEKNSTETNETSSKKSKKKNRIKKQENETENQIDTIQEFESKESSNKKLKRKNKMKNEFENLNIDGLQKKKKLEESKGLSDTKEEHSLDKIIKDVKSSQKEKKKKHHNVDREEYSIQNDLEDDFPKKKKKKKIHHESYENLEHSTNELAQNNLIVEEKCIENTAEFKVRKKKERRK